MRNKLDNCYCKSVSLFKTSLTLELEGWRYGKWDDVGFKLICLTKIILDWQTLTYGKIKSICSGRLKKIFIPTSVPLPFSSRETISLSELTLHIKSTRIAHWRKITMKINWERAAHDHTVSIHLKSSHSLHFTWRTERLAYFYFIARA